MLSQVKVLKEFPKFFPVGTQNEAKRFDFEANDLVTPHYNEMTAYE